MVSCNRADIVAIVVVVVAASVMVSLLTHAPRGQSLSGWLWGRACGRPEFPCSFTLNFFGERLHHVDCRGKSLGRIKLSQDKF